MQILEHGQAQERTLLFFPCTAEPVWAFEGAIRLSLKIPDEIHECTCHR